MDRDPSRGALFMALLAVALIGLSFALPWWSFDSSTGRKTAEGGPQDPEDTRVERHSLDFLPFRLVGDQEPSDREGAEAGVQQLGIAASVAGGALVVFILAEIVRFIRPFSRGFSLVVSLLAVAATAAGLLLTWLVLPDTMAGNGVTGAFSDVLLDPGYVRTTLGPGFIVAALAVPMALGALAFRFQAGSHDPTAIEAYA